MNERIENLIRAKGELAGRIMALWHEFDELSARCYENDKLEAVFIELKVDKKNELNSHVKRIFEAMIRLESQYRLILEEEGI